MPTPSNIKIYDFSGTGNAAAATSWIHEETAKKAIQTEIHNLSILKRRNISKPKENEIIGFVWLTHGFNFRPIRFHFLLRFPRGNKNQVFIVNTRTGMKNG